MIVKGGFVHVAFALIKRITIVTRMMGILHSSGRGSMGETSFLIRNFKIVLIIWANNYIIEE